MNLSYVKFDIVFVVFISAMLFQFTQIAPWLGSKPIEHFPSTELEVTEIPKGTRSYNVNHGDYMFFKHGTIQQDPIEFFIRIALLLLTALLNYYVNRRMDTSYFKRYAYNKKTK